MWGGEKILFKHLHCPSVMHKVISVRKTGPMDAMHLSTRHGIYYCDVLFMYLVGRTCVTGHRSCQIRSIHRLSYIFAVTHKKNVHYHTFLYKFTEIIFRFQRTKQTLASDEECRHPSRVRARTCRYMHARALWADPYWLHRDLRFRTHASAEFQVPHSQSRSDASYKKRAQCTRSRG